MSLDESVHRIGESLRVQGFAWIAAAVTDAEFVALGHALGEAHDARVAFRRALSRHQEHAHAIRLEPGQVLVVDNHRILHGRRGLMPNSARRLRRLWVHVHDSSVQTVGCGAAYSRRSSPARCARSSWPASAPCMTDVFRPGEAGDARRRDSDVITS